MPRIFYLKCLKYFEYNWTASYLVEAVLELVGLVGWVDVHLAIWSSRVQSMNDGQHCDTILQIGQQSVLRRSDGQLDKAPHLSISIIIWILSSDTICQLNRFHTNSEAVMLSNPSHL